MRATCWIIVPFLLLILVGSRAPVTLEARIDTILESSDTGPALWGIHVVDIDDGTVLYSRNADKPLLPASNQKILTSSAALDALGSTYRYQTTLHFTGKVDGATLRGDLIIQGSGDPTFGSTEVRGRDPLRQWAQHSVPSIPFRSASLRSSPSCRCYPVVRSASSRSSSH